MDPNDSDTRTARELATLVLANDPLEARLSASERRRRLLRGVEQLRPGLEACAADRADAMRPEIDALERRLRGRTRQDRDTIEEGVDLLYRAARALDACGATSALGRAWVLIGERHGPPLP